MNRPLREDVQAGQPYQIQLKINSRETPQGLLIQPEMVPSQHSAPPPPGRNTPPPGRNMSPQPGRNMPPQPGRNMSPQPGSNMSPQPGRNMSPQPGRNIPQPGRNMSPQPGRNTPPPGRNMRTIVNLVLKRQTERSMNLTLFAFFFTRAIPKGLTFRLCLHALHL